MNEEHYDLSYSNIIRVNEKWDGRGMWHVWGKEVYIGFWWGDLTESDNVEDLVMDGRIILKLIFKKWDGNAWTGLVWLRIGTGGGRLWVRELTLGSHKLRGICWLVEDLLASEEELCSREIFIYFRPMTNRLLANVNIFTNNWSSLIIWLFLLSLFFWLYFVSFYIWLYVLHASV